MAELADALDLGSSSKEWRFKSSWSHQRKNCAFARFQNKFEKHRLFACFFSLATKRNSHFIGELVATYLSKKIVPRIESAMGCWTISINKTLTKVSNFGNGKKQPRVAPHCDQIQFALRWRFVATYLPKKIVPRIVTAMGCWTISINKNSHGLLDD